jgi:PleD family two-component response regulator
MIEKLHVLIIDDDKDTANFFSMVLSLVGFTCDIVNSAKQALSRIAVTQPDMILLDMRLGLEIGGEDILYQIRSNPRLDETRVIVITAYPAMAEPITNLADLILLKPVDVDQLKTLASRLAVLGDHTQRYHFRDPVTDLFTREFFLTRMELAYERARRRSEFLFAILVFSFTIETPGAGKLEETDWDALLRLAANRLRKYYRPIDTIARLDNEQFATLHEDLKDPGDLQVLIQRLRAGLADAFQLGDRQYQMQISIGAAIYSPKYDQPIEMLRAARQAWELAVKDGPEGVRIAER